MPITFSNKELSLLASIQVILFQVKKPKEETLNDLHQPHINEKFNLLIQKNFGTKLNFSKNK